MPQHTILVLSVRIAEWLHKKETERERKPDTHEACALHITAEAGAERPTDTLIL